MINQPKLNHQISAAELRVIGAKGENLGVMSRDQAIKLSVEQGLDLIEISPLANPPVACIMSFDKYRYQQEKKAKEQRASYKNQDPKQVQITARAAKNDLEIKAKKADEFLGEGIPVTVMMVLRGREKGNKDWARTKMNEFLKMITVPYRTISEPRWSMRGVAIMISKKTP